MKRAPDHFVYGLCDANRTIRYVGVSADPQGRSAQHFFGRRWPRRWGFSPDVILDAGRRAAMYRSEARLIRALWARGFPLLNLHGTGRRYGPGGEAPRPNSRRGRPVPVRA